MDAFSVTEQGHFFLATKLRIDNVTYSLLTFIEDRSENFPLFIFQWYGAPLLIRAETVFFPNWKLRRWSKVREQEAAGLLFRGINHFFILFFLLTNVLF